MSKEKQIEEMAKWLCSDCSKDVPCSLVPIGAMCKTVWKRSEALYNAGYRKQSEGEWIEHRHTRPYEEVFYLCSKCGRKVYQKEPYCHCGAKMGGGAE